MTWPRLFDANHRRQFATTVYLNLSLEARTCSLVRTICRMASSLPTSIHVNANPIPGPITVGYQLGNSSRSVQEVLDNLNREDENEGSDVDGHDVKTRLLDYLDNIRAPGTFATVGRLDLKVQPRVHLLGDGPAGGHDIEVPLSSADASKIISAAHQAPFGKGTETIVDTSVRNTWELNPDKFSLSREWQPYIDSIKARACQDLGVRSENVRAGLYKMLLYQKGAMFKPHADSEKTPGMFGTLVVSLPSRHNGGAVIVSHGGQCLTLQTQNHEYLAW